MIVVEVLSTVLVFLCVGLGLSYSLSLIFDFEGSKRAKWFEKWGKTCTWLGVIGSVIAWFRPLGLGEISPFPWNHFVTELARDGILAALLSSLSLLLFELWAFVLVGHFCAEVILEQTGKGPWYPYVINILVGLLITTPGNPFWRLLAFPHGE
jgi:hypothetical protein